jgi:hypothetical protein
LWEKLTFMPKPGCLPQMSQTAAMFGEDLPCSGDTAEDSRSPAGR